MKRFYLREQRHRENCISDIGELPLDQKRPYVITIQRPLPSRTLEQNAKIHKILSTIADETGHTIEEIKDFLMKEFGYIVQFEFRGKIITRRRSTTELSVGEMSKFIEQVYAWADENGFML